MSVIYSFNSVELSLPILDNGLDVFGTVTLAFLSPPIIISSKLIRPIDTTLNCISGDRFEASVPHLTRDGNITIKQHPNVDSGSSLTIEYSDGTTMTMRDGAEEEDKALQPGSQASDEGKEHAIRAQEQMQGEVQQLDDHVEIVKGTRKRRFVRYIVRLSNILLYLRIC